MTVRVLLADDNALFREGMTQLLGRCTDVLVIGQARDGTEAVRKAMLLRPDVVLMDVGMPRGGGVDATRQLLAERPAQVICMLTSSEQEADLFAAIRAGARGYLLKTVDQEELCRGLHLLVEGGAIVTPRLAAALLDAFATFRHTAHDGPRRIDTLSPREREVLTLVTHGESNAEIGAALIMAASTVKVHVRNILHKLQLHSRVQAAAYAVQEGLVIDVRRPR